MLMQRWKWIITGGVQGVGFRPFVYKAALHAKVTGQVLNTPEGVLIEVQGTPDRLEAFEDTFSATIPPLARIVTWDREVTSPLPGEDAFQILKSTGGHGHQVLISPDVATCDDCIADMRDPGNRRYRYAFTNCTNCGPRYTITRSIPYDRACTSMSCFPLCADCQEEYENPLDRRFHAQPNACPECGPKLWLTDRTGRTLCENDEAVRRTAALLLEGRLLAMKGLGGFHLVCDARDQEAVQELRTRKNRKDKPLAIMVADLDAALSFCVLSEAERELLTGRQRPIVLARARKDSGLAPGLSPDTAFLGVMLPYTPLHHVLFDELKRSGILPAALVMTSGNLSSDPICLGNREALRRLSGIADNFLLHDRDILIRCDDSVLRVVDEKPQFIRRARGYTPAPIDLAKDGPTVLGVGPLLKNTLCLTKGRQAFVSQHIGDLDHLEAYGFFREIRAHLQDILQVEPQAVVHDLHPDFLSTGFARESGLPCLPLQHHFAHIHAVLAENRHIGTAIGLALDGVGLGDDGTMWGGEALLVDTAKLEHRRLARFSQVMLPGGDVATREPWRLARAHLHALGIQAPGEKPWPWLQEYAAADKVVAQVLERRINSPLSSSCGRLFDAVSAMLGLCERISYEGQAAIRLEAIQDKEEKGVYSCPVIEYDGIVELDTLELFAQVHAEWRDGERPATISRRFHLGLIDGLCRLCLHLAERCSCTTVALSGGVMQNLTLATELPRALAAQGATVLTHRELPPNDACISLGQAAYGQLVLQP
ncbi:hydrogenase maturation protein HypF [Desulfomicrobium macestii]|uniref:Carbamoyltransferase n=1 Tax=Desulfomicrobium macestii TaxID=90731 RepID=A0ABR9H598_9BACT|nr:carbamoyltransferase HypF [Desulfomicrobium macestii]MBE1425866.1 hydrogenase maturation protein HypF [Desulfomicrobium macestii]